MSDELHESYSEKECEAAEIVIKRFTRMRTMLGQQPMSPMHTLLAAACVWNNMVALELEASQGAAEAWLESQAPKPDDTVN